MRTVLRPRNKPRMNSTMKTLILLPLATLLFLTACATFEVNAYRTLGVTAHTVDTLMTTWADASVAGRTNPDLDARVTAANGEYRRQMSATKLVIESYRSGAATQDQVTAALSAVAANKAAILNLIIPLVTPAKATELRGLP